MYQFVAFLLQVDEIYVNSLKSDDFSGIIVNMKVGGYMRLKEILDVCNINVVIDQYALDYEMPYLDAHRLINGVISELKDTEDDGEYNDTLSIMVAKEDGADLVDIYGWDDVLKEAFSLTFTPWDEWLKLKVEDEVFSKFSVDDILVHCISEMTLNGESNDDVQARAKDMEELFEKLIAAEAEQTPVDLTEHLSTEDLSDLQDGSTLKIQLPVKNDKLN